MLGRKRGPYRQYLRQDEPYKSRSLRKKIRRSNKECKFIDDLSLNTTEFDNEAIDIDECVDFENEYAEVTSISLQEKSVDDCDNDFNSSVELRGDCQESENFNNLDDKVSKDPSGSDWTGLDNLIEEADGNYSDSDSCSSTGTIYDFDSDNSTDGSAYDDCDLETPHDNEPPLYEGASLSLSSSILLTLSFVFKHRLTGQCFTDLLSVIEAHCPKPNHCKTSVRKLFDHFKNIKGNLVKHIFCSYCKGYICEQRQAEPVILPDSCKICGTSVTNNTSFFLEAPFVDQITKFFKGKHSPTVLIFICLPGL